VPIVFQGTDGVWPKGVYGLSFRRPVRVEALPALEARAFASPRQLMAEARGRIDAALGAGR
jgi:hypothetical protein